MGIVFLLKAIAQVTIMVLLVRTVHGRVHHHRHARCEEPVNWEEMKANLHNNPDHESLFNIPRYSASLRTLTDVLSETPQYVHVEERCLDGQIECQPGVRIRREQKFTTCPWYYVNNTDINRYPKTIFRAKCICRNCLDNTRNLCKPVPNFIRVLRRTGCSYGRYEYEVTLESAPSGCMCTTNTTRLSMPPSYHGFLPQTR